MRADVQRLVEAARGLLTDAVDIGNTGHHEIRANRVNALRAALEPFTTPDPEEPGS